jgi:hypothetical protein
MIFHKRSPQILFGVFCLLSTATALSSHIPEGLRIGIAGHAFEHLGDLGEQADAAADSGASIIYISGVGVLGYSGLPDDAELQKQRQLAANYVRHARKKGIRFAIGYVCATSIVDLDKFAAHWTVAFRQRFQTPPPEWRQQDRQGHPLPSWYGGLYQPACMCNPDWQTYEHFMVKQQIEAGCDGIFFDNPTVHPQGCYCPFCMEKYASFLGQDSPVRKNNTNALETLREHAATHTEKFMEFRCTIGRDFLGDMRRYARTINPRAWMTANNSLNSADVLFSQSRTYGYNIFEMSRTEDLVVVEDMSSQPRALPDGSMREYGPTYEQLTAISHGKPIAAVCLADSDYHTPPNLVRLAMAEAAAHGCSHLWWPVWPEAERQRMSATVRPEADFLREHASLLNDAAARCDVLLLLPITDYLRTAECKTSQDAARLTAANISYRVQTLEELEAPVSRGPRPKVILTPSGVALSQTQTNILRNRFGSQAKWLSTGETNWLAQAKSLAPPISIQGSGSPFIRATLQDKKNRTILHLLNLNVLKLSSFQDRITPASGLEISANVPARKVRHVRAFTADGSGSSGDVEFSQQRIGKGSTVIFKIPQLAIHTIVLIE